MCVHTVDRHNSAARDRNNILPHETPRERFQQEEDKERAESMTNRKVRLHSAPHAQRYVLTDNPIPCPTPTSSIFIKTSKEATNWLYRIFPHIPHGASALRLTRQGKSTSLLLTLWEIITSVFWQMLLAFPKSCLKLCASQPPFCGGKCKNTVFPDYSSTSSIEQVRFTPGADKFWCQIC